MRLKQLFSILLCLACLLSPWASAQYEDIVDALYARACSGKTLQEWIDDDLSSLAGSAADGYILNLCKSDHTLNLSSYIDTASAMLEDGKISNPVSRMRTALALISCGARDRIPVGFADASIGKLGVMSYVYGLNLLCNGVPSESWTRDSIIAKLSALQKDDGGWAVMGNYGDVDVTAMCLQALALCSDSEDVQPLIDEGLAFLSLRQQENASFISMGNENSESASQVLIALASLGVDPVQDARFIKAGKTILDALLEYRLPSGGFAHFPDAAENDMASMQALTALTALEHIGDPYYDLSSVSFDMHTESASRLSGWKMYALIAVAVFLLGGSIFSLTRRHGRLKQLLFIVLLAAIAAVLILTINIESAGSYYSEDTSAPADGTVHLSIRCDTVAGRASDGSTPESGAILERTEIPFAEGDTVFDALTAAARKYRIQMEYQGGSEDMAYINGINYLYEYAYGDLSGWVYDVNGERYSVGCGAFALRDGDEIIWQYTLELGEDLK